MNVLFPALIAIVIVAFEKPLNAQMSFRLIGDQEALRDGNPDGWYRRNDDGSYAITIDEHRKGKYGHRSIRYDDILLCTRKDKTAYCRFRVGRLIELGDVAHLPKLTSVKHPAVVWLGGSRRFINWSIQVNMEQNAEQNLKVTIAQRKSSSNDGKWSRKRTLAEGDSIVIGHQEYLVHRIVPSDQEKQLIGWVELVKSG